MGDTSAQRETGAPVVRRATEPWQPLEGSWARILGDYGALTFEGDARSCSAADAPFCFSGTLADGTPIHGAYAVIGDTLAMRYVCAAGAPVVRFLRLVKDDEVVLALYERSVLVASLVRVDHACTTDCPKVRWATGSVHAR